MSAARAGLPPVLMLGAIGVAAGFLSALFGVGGGIVVVPLLIVAAGYAPKRATGTSLAAIVVTALFGVAAFAALDEVSWRHAALVGVPAVAGAVVGVRLQRALSSQRLTLLFAAFLAVAAVLLIVE